jgi:hypothetical protein
MSLKNLLKIMICLNVLLITTTIFTAPVSAKEVMTEPPSYDFMEQVIVMVNCSDATLTPVISLMTTNETLVHYPSGVNMLDTNFENCESVSVSVSPTGSALVYIFSNIETAVEAKEHADAITPSIGAAFSLSFSFFSLGTTDSILNVTYTAPAVTDVASYYGSTLNPLCLKSDLAGFSTAVPNLLNVQSSKSYAGISAYKTVGGYDWQYMFFAGYFGYQIPTGTGYIIDVLSRIGATSLSPSDYSYLDGYYTSTVTVIVEPESTVEVASCTPNVIFIPYVSRGWYIFPSDPTETLIGTFYFGNDFTPITILTLAFNGTIVPELSSLALTIALIVCSMGIVAFKKRFAKNFS